LRQSGKWEKSVGIAMWKSRYKGMGAGAEAHPDFGVAPRKSKAGEGPYLFSSTKV